MPENEDPNDDDYVARLLAEDAKKSSMRYASAGLSALLPTRSVRPGPKPNTRFLNHLVRDVDSHNAALRRKEQLESQARIEGFRKSEREDERRRALDLAGGRSERHQDSHDRRSYRISRAHRSSLSPKPRKSRDAKDRREKEQKEGDHDTGHRRKRRRVDSDGDIGNGYETKKHRRHSSRTNGHDETHDEKRKHHVTLQDRRHSQRTRSPRHDKYGIDRPGYKNDDSKRTHDSSRDFKLECNPQRSCSPSTSENDPLENVIGPIPRRSTSPKVQIRGRGAHRPFKSNIDSHFSASYDPSLDVQPEDDSDRSDWDMALEALRDRTMWKKKQTERMREAGFNDEEIQKWEKGAMGANADQDVRDVKWKNKGEDRDWDVGKDLGHEEIDRLDRSSEPRPVRKKSREKNGTQDGWKQKDSGLLRSFRSALGS